MISNKKQINLLKIKGLDPKHFNISKPVNNPLAVGFNLNQWYPSTLDEKVLKRTLNKLIREKGYKLGIKGSIVAVDAPLLRGGNECFMKTNVVLYLKKPLGDNTLVEFFEETYCSI